MWWKLIKRGEKVELELSGAERKPLLTRLVLLLTHDRRLALPWRVILYVILYGTCLILRGPLQDFLNAHAQSIPILIRIVLIESIGVSMAVGSTIGITYIVRRYVDRRPWAGMALPAPWQRRREIAVGFGLGMAMILAVVAIESALGWIRFLGVREKYGLATIVAVLTSRFIHSG